MQSIEYNVSYLKLILRGKVAASLVKSNGSLPPGL